MKALIVLDDKEKLSSISEKLTNAGFDTICYQWLMKALDNLEEISPHLVIISAEDYPRHWKVFVQHIKAHFKDDNTKVFLLTSSLTEEEQKKVKYLGIQDIIYDINTDLQKVISAFTLEPALTAETLSEPVPALTAETLSEPVPVLTVEPVLEPEPAFAAEPVLEPEPTLIAESLLEPEPALTAEPVPEPVPALTAETLSESEPALTAEPLSEPVPVLTAEPVPEPVQTLTAEPVPEPVPVLTAETLSEPEPALTAETLSEPVPVLTAEPVLEPVPVLAAEPLSEPVPALTAEPVSEPVPVLTAEPVLEPEPALTTETLSEPVPVLTAESVPKPVQTLQTEPVFQRKIVSSCDFFITNPSTNRIISGKVKKYKYPTLIFIPNNQDEKKSLRFGQIFENCILKQVVNNKELSSTHRCQIRGFTDNSIEFCLLR